MKRRLREKVQKSQTLWRKVAESHERRDYGKQGRDNANHIKLMCSTSTSLCRRRLHWLRWSEALFCKSNAAICSAVQQDNACWHGQTTFSYFESQIFKRFSLLLRSKMISRSLNTNLWNQRLNLPDRQTFLPRPFLHVVVLITIIQSSFKCGGLMFFPIHSLPAFKSFSTISCLALLSFYFFPVSESACGLKLFKCSLLRTSCFITYLLDLLSHIFSLKDKLKEKCTLSSSQREPEDLKRTQERHWFK